MGKKVAWIDDTEMARYLRISVRTLLNALSRDGNVNGVSPRYIGTGIRRKQRRWSVSQIAKADGVTAEAVLDAAQ